MKQENNTSKVEGSKEFILQFYMSNADLTFEEAAIRAMEDYASLQQGTGWYSLEDLRNAFDAAREVSKLPLCVLRKYNDSTEYINSLNK